jgi:hypothetical protein
MTMNDNKYNLSTFTLQRQARIISHADAVNSTRSTFTSQAQAKMTELADNAICATQMYDEDNILPTPKWIHELGHEIANEYQLSQLDGTIISGMIAKAIRINLNIPNNNERECNNQAR